MKIGLRSYGKQNKEKLRPVVSAKPARADWEQPVNKFSNQDADDRGIKFQSKHERDRYRELVIMEAGGVIQGLETQVPYSIDIGGVHVCTYIADFRYQENGATVVEDAKGAKTAVYKLKKKLMFACHGIEIQEV